MGFFKSTKGSIVSDFFKSLDDQSIFGKNESCDVAVYPDRIEITGFLSKRKAVLPMERVTDVYWGVETEIQKQNKSPIARAVIGGLLVPGAGAVVGAISGMGTKDKKVRRTMFILSYTSADGQEKFLQFEDSRHYKGFKVYSKIVELMPKTEQPGEILL